jgi:hypothetical protein
MNNDLDESKFLYTTYSHTEGRMGRQPYYTFLGTEKGLVEHLWRNSEEVLISAMHISRNSFEIFRENCSFNYVG